MNLRPRRDLVIVEPQERSSVILMDAIDSVQFGQVLVAGSDTDVTLGDTVAFHKDAGEATEIEQRRVLALRGGDILAVLG